jgi:hypothetical protein
MVRIRDIYEPVRENAALYGELYDIFCRTYEGLTEKGVFEKISEIQAR